MANLNINFDFNIPIFNQFNNKTDNSSIQNKKNQSNQMLHDLEKFQVNPDLSLENNKSNSSNFSNSNENFYVRKDSEMLQKECKDGSCQMRGQMKYNLSRNYTFNELQNSSKPCYI